MSRRKRFRTKVYEALWEQYKHRCWRCKRSLEPPLIPGKDWHWGHIVALSCGGEDKPANMAPECRNCNETDARENVTPLAAKIKRIKRRHIGAPKAETNLARQWRLAKERGYNPWGRKP